MENLVVIGVDVMDDYIVEKWRKHYKQRLKLKNSQSAKPLLSQNPNLTQQKSSELAPFNINHSYNMYKSTDIKQYGYGHSPFTSPKSLLKSKSSKYKKPPLPPRSSSTRSPAAKSPRRVPKLPLALKVVSKRGKRSPRPPPKAKGKGKAKSPLALNISPKSSHSSKYYQHHDIIMHYPNGTKNTTKHYQKNGHHNNGSNRKKKKQNDHNEDVYVD
eukprot:UN02452